MSSSASVPEDWSQLTSNLAALHHQVVSHESIMKTDMSPSQLLHFPGYFADIDQKQMEELKGREMYRTVALRQGFWGTLNQNFRKIIRASIVECSSAAGQAEAGELIIDLPSVLVKQLGNDEDSVMEDLSDNILSDTGVTWLSMLANRETLDSVAADVACIGLHSHLEECMKSQGIDFGEALEVWCNQHHSIVTEVIEEEAHTAMFAQHEFRLGSLISSASLGFRQYQYHRPIRAVNIPSVTKGFEEDTSAVREVWSCHDRKPVPINIAYQQRTSTDFAQRTGRKHVVRKRHDHNIFDFLLFSSANFA